MPAAAAVVAPRCGGYEWESVWGSLQQPVSTRLEWWPRSVALGAFHLRSGIMGDVAEGGDKTPGTVPGGELGRWQSLCIPVVWFARAPSGLFSRI